MAGEFLANSASVSDVDVFGYAQKNATKRATASDLQRLTLAYPVVKNEIDISAWSEQVYFAVQKAVYKLGQEARDAARRICPVDTSALRASIYVTAPSSRVDQAANFPYGRKSAPGRASAGYRRAVEKSAIIAGHIVAGEGGGLLGVNTEFAGMPYGPATLRPNAHAERAGMKRGATTIQHKGALGRALGARSMQSYPQEVDDVESLPFTPMPFSTKGQFWINVGASAYYAAYVEFGGSNNQKAQPFLGPAIRDVERKLERTIATAMKSVQATVKKR